MDAYDRHNVNEFILFYEEGRYICSCCGRVTLLSDSVSSRGYNLVCVNCMYKLQDLLDSHDIINMIHRAGEKKRRIERNNKV